MIFWYWLLRLLDYDLNYNIDIYDYYYISLYDISIDKNINIANINHSFINFIFVIRDEFFYFTEFIRSNIFGRYGFDI